MGTHVRQLVKIVKEICLENNIDFQSFSYDWILQLSANSRKMFIYGYKFPNNNASIEQICNDKSALSDILAANNIPHVRHYYFMSPNNEQYTGENGDWDKMKGLLHKYKKLVCKSNTGSGGRNVFKVNSQKTLEIAVYNIFSKTKSMCIAPYKIIKAEYRIIIVNSNIGVIYEKRRPMVTGNGFDTIGKLIDQDPTLHDVEIDSDLNFDLIPQLGEKIEVSWKHNLGQGAKPVIVNDVLLKEKLSALALSCALALDLEFASIDIVEDETGLEILEINSGIMMENLAQSSKENYYIAKEIYQKAIFSFLKMDDPKYKYFVQRPRKKHFVLPVLEEIAKERNVTIIPDEEEGNFSIFTFNNGKRFIAKDYPFNINYAGSISLCTNKSACAYFLDIMGFHVPKQKYFVKKSHAEVTLTELKKFFDNPLELLGFDFPMIIKPNGLSQGVGVYKISNKEEGIICAKKIMSLKEKLFLLQEYCSGHDFRIVVLGDKVIQAYERVPFQIIGNGYDTIETLLQQKVASFKLAGRDKSVDSSDSRIAKNIARQGYTLQSVLAAGVACRLQDIANLSLGGTTADKTADISSYYQKLAVKIAQSLNLKLCGIDIIAQDITNPDNKDYTILEINSAPGLDNYVYEGQQQDDYVKQLYSMVFDYLEKM